MRTLNEKDIHNNPIKQFQIWFDEAMVSKCLETNAMTLATCTPDGMPSARIVLLKDISDKGFTFFTNYQSKKGKQIAQNPFGALVFFWPELERQVRIEGTIEKTPRHESDLYFSSRPKLSKLSACISPQSEVIGSRLEIEESLKKMESEVFEHNLKRPDFWGGFILKPSLIEFWQGRPGRLHDRIQYIRSDNRSWCVQRLAP